MKIRRTVAVVAVCLVASLAAMLAAGQKDGQAEVQLKAAMHRELVDGDLKGAIEAYQRILGAFGGNRGVVAQALVQMGQCYEKLGQKDARSAYERVLREYADQAEPTRVARQRLAALAPAPTPAAPAAGPEMMLRRVWTRRGTLATAAGTPSPDGRYLPYYNGEVGDLSVHDFTTGQDRRLNLKKGDWTNNDEEASDPVFAPDSRRILYTWFNKKSFELRVTDVDGAAPRIVYSAQDDVPTPYGWTPDAANILTALRDANRNWRLVLVSVADGAIRPLATLGNAPPTAVALSPDGRHVALDRRANESSTQRDVFVLDTATGREVPVIQHGADDRFLAWTPDGRRILFNSDRSGTRDAWAIDIAAGTPQGAPALVKRNLGDVQPLGFTTAGTLYYRIPGMSREIHTATIDFATGKVLDPPRPAPRRSTGWNTNPDWSWDGQFLAFTSRRRPQNEQFIVIQSTRTGEERDLKLVLKDATPRFGLRWAPDGRSLLLETGMGANACALTQIDVQTGAAAPLVKMANCDLTGFGYTGDGRTLFYTAFDPATSLHALVSRDLATGRDTEIGRYYIRFPALSPDGRWIAFLGFSKTAKTYPLTVIPATGGAPREVCSFPATGPRGVAWTPDGRQLIVGNLRDRKAELWRVPAAGGEPVRLDVAVNGMWQFRLHPDGRRLAMEVWENNEEVWALENLLPRQEQKPSGMAARRVLSMDSDVGLASIDRAATFFSFTDWETGDLAIRELPSGNTRRLTNKGPFTVSREYTENSVPSPDGRQVAYSWMTQAGVYEIRVVGLDGSPARVIHAGKGSLFAVPLAWSPDGTRVLATLVREAGSTQVALVSVPDATTQIITTVPGTNWAVEQAAFSPDGRHIAFDQWVRGDHLQCDVFVVSATGGPTTPLVQHAAHDRLLGWSPDGRYILFTSDRAGTTDAWLLPVIEGKPRGAPVLVKKDIGRITPMGFARDGSYYYGVGTGGRDVYVAAVDPASGKVLAPPRLVPERFLGSNVMPEWSPDGTSLFYMSRRGPVGPAFNIPSVKSMQTGEVRELATGLLFLNQVRWWPDGRSLIAVCIDRTEKDGICRIDVQTGQITMLGNGVFPAALPGGKAILVLYPKDNQMVIWQRDLDGGADREVVRPDSYRYAASPDGRQLAFQVSDAASKEAVVKIMPLAGGEARGVFRSKKTNMSVSWTADGRQLLVGQSDDQNEALWLVPVDGGKPRTFTLGTTGVLGPRLHPDGRQVVFYKESDRGGEIWVLENVLPPATAVR